MLYSNPEQATTFNFFGAKYKRFTNKIRNYLSTKFPRLARRMRKYINTNKIPIFALLLLISSEAHTPINNLAAAYVAKINNPLVRIAATALGLLATPYLLTFDISIFVICTNLLYPNANAPFLFIGWKELFDLFKYMRETYREFKIIIYAKEDLLKTWKLTPEEEAHYLDICYERDDFWNGVTAENKNRIEQYNIIPGKEYTEENNRFKCIISGNVIRDAVYVESSNGKRNYYEFLALKRWVYSQIEYACLNGKFQLPFVAFDPNRNPIDTHNPTLPAGVELMQDIADWKLGIFSDRVGALKTSMQRSGSIDLERQRSPSPTAAPTHIDHSPAILARFNAARDILLNALPRQTFTNNSTPFSSSLAQRPTPQVS
jgi:hypothetical protein